MTILGIVIGVFLIVSLLSLSEGLKTAITKQLKAMGGNMIMIMPGDESNMMMSFIGGGQIEKENIEAIKRAEGVDKILSMSYSGIVMRYKEEAKTVFLTGQSWSEAIDILKGFQGWSLSSGRWPVPGKNEVIIGQQVSNEIFEEKIRINTEIIIKGKKFEVVGVLNSLGSKTDDSMVYIDMPIYQNLTGEKRGSARLVMVKIEEGVSVNEVAENIKENLKKTEKKKAGSDASNFSVITSEKMSGIAGNILGIIQFVIFIFASIAIVVGGIGITNTMFTSVRERTREIGIMKAIGAKSNTVLLIFLMEAGVIGFSGGIGGTALGVLFAKIIERYGQALFYFSASATPGLIIFGLVFSFFIGCLSGFFPARRAARLKPVEALRHYE